MFKQPQRGICPLGNTLIKTIYSFLHFLMPSCIQAGYQPLRYSCSFPCYPQAWLPEACSFLVCFILLFCFQTLLPPIKLKWHMVGDDLFSCDRLTALMFKGELALLGFAALNFITLCFVLPPWLVNVSAPWPESPSWGLWLRWFGS